MAMLAIDCVLVDNKSISGRKHVGGLAGRSVKNGGGCCRPHQFTNHGRNSHTAHRRWKSKSYATLLATAVVDLEQPGAWYLVGGNWRRKSFRVILRGEDRSRSRTRWWRILAAAAARVLSTKNNIGLVDNAVWSLSPWLKLLRISWLLVASVGWCRGRKMLYSSVLVWVFVRGDVSGWRGVTGRCWHSSLMPLRLCGCGFLLRIREILIAIDVAFCVPVTGLYGPLLVPYRCLPFDYSTSFRPQHHR